jgi:UDP-N-acetylglucosamine--N-acetylmuramyl-(pentapeptide) pyrophosphoryl-undecaprenol N-acetylglucosamine transferase
MARGMRQATGIVEAFHPDVVLATGGYVSVPLVMAARDRCPIAIYLPDLEPGLAVRFLSRFAARICVSFDVVAQHFPAEKVVVTGYPVRPELYLADRDKARAALGLGDVLPTLLVLGGSRGAHSLNEAVRHAMPDLLRSVEVVHICGYEDYERLAHDRAAWPEDLQIRWHLYPYLHEEMTDALASADLVVARAGAATLGEFPAVGLPAVLVPYPYAGEHQQANASYLADRGAARIVSDERIGTDLLPIVRELLEDRERLTAMSAASRALAAPRAADAIVETLQDLAQQRGATR